MFWVNNKKSEERRTGSGEEVRRQLWWAPGIPAVRTRVCWQSINKMETLTGVKDTHTHTHTHTHTIPAQYIIMQNNFLQKIKLDNFIFLEDNIC